MGTLLQRARDGEIGPEIRTVAELRAFDKHIDQDVFDVLSLEQMIDRRQAVGGTATKTVRSAIAAAEKQLAQGA